ncbi:MULTISPECIES: glycosyltransferase family 2 protein [Chryseobacterium]|uniref:N-acetylglucosaminyl-diphospho-decaprenol L-rhamnosyltransferase n=1 Tax=Chryseobacterium camelliae TaxID=1265445 RepID=A0ABU0TNA9_9FLAO|nr:MULTISPECIES: glycosyltransferase family 2 protein [Chryseobacterium]MDT3407618.1 N-acetylglucosaminyl-diphospho-decaprenol L-rhamnosyltransferase [Pseudacidovorax intermedius]MDQ1098530.1 N-acetylglucosaminyl-diphospho-decaprenol L-rhamnosyltransferase [Chryseobacterium camelliae]MDQ1102454.1 N-acetylglucosaminyl-diphospho-decaprenol L-rhamnosyltransferase [Chryseobacterium sp. SORGH_AS_1048]MDR6085887.1 N-acetylglucosaminyl-diphospho-decaprenol L-rhamnosyltransferase [Chryseobacterium sp. 
MMQKVHIIIVTYNAMKWVEQCFGSLRISSVQVNCTVVDNGSSDGTQEYISKKFPEVELIRSEKNLGFGKANNIGIEKAYASGAEFFYLMNQDAWLYEDSLENLLAVYHSHPNKHEIGILSPMHIDGSERKLDIFLDKYIATNYEHTRLISDLYFQDLKPYYELKFINAAHWLLPKSTIETVGGFNPYFFHYGEDAEYANRVTYHGKKTLLVPGSKVVHDGKQFLNKVDYSVYEDLGVEINIMNPNLDNSFQQEKKALQQSMVKSMVLRKFDDYKKLLRKYRKISKEEDRFKVIRDQVSQKKPTFLNI